MFNKKVLHVAVIMILGLVGFAGTAQECVDVALAKIERLGPDPRFADSASSGVMVQLTDTHPNPKWSGIRQFYLSAALGNTGVATLLTAFSLGETVWVRIGGAAETGSLITIIFVNAPAP
jgi:hypothetical protein